MTKWTYLVAFSPICGTHDKIRQFIDSRRDIVNWKVLFERTFLIVSGLSASSLTDMLRKFTKDKGRFVVVDTNTDRSGWLQPSAWDLMSNPKAVGE